jgi:hypothetical protein
MRDQRLAHRASRQLGLFTHTQAVECGFPRETIRRRLQQRVWDEIDVRVYRAATAARPDARQRIMARVLATGGVASDLSAAALFGLLPHSDEPHVVVTRGARAGTRQGVRTTRSLERFDTTTVDGIPVTSPVRTLIDVVAVTSPTEFEDTLDLALVTGVVRIRPLEARARALWTPARPGCAIVVHLLENRSPDVLRARNKWEARVLRLFKAAGVAPPCVNFRLSIGGQNREIDLAWLDLKIAVEFDGFVPHSSRRVFDDDRVRQNALVAEGWRVFRLTKTALERDARTAIVPILAALAG